MTKNKSHIIAQDVWDRDVFIKEECQTTKLTSSNKLLETIASGCYCTLLTLLFGGRRWIIAGFKIRLVCFCRLLTLGLRNQLCSFLMEKEAKRGRLSGQFYSSVPLKRNSKTTMRCSGTMSKKPALAIVPFPSHLGIKRLKVWRYLSI